MTTSKSKIRRRRPVAARPLQLWQDSNNNQEVRIEIIPLIDVIFCILTFFILAAVGLSRQQAISLNLPKASSGTPLMREMMVVSLDELGQVYLEKNPVTQNQLTTAVENYFTYNPTGAVVLHAANNVSYNEVIQVLDLLREVGGNRVALATLPAEQGSSQIPTPTPYGVPIAPSEQVNPLQPNPVPNPNSSLTVPTVPDPNANE